MRFSSDDKLNTQSQFRQVFNAGKKYASRDFLILAINNFRTKPRLGLAVSKNHIRLATRRNRVKRIIRETFRRHIDSLPGLDIIVLVNKRINANDTELYGKLDRYWNKIANEKNHT